MIEGVVKCGGKCGECQVSGKCKEVLGEVKGSVGRGMGKCEKRYGKVCWGVGRCGGSMGGGVGKCKGRCAGGVR